MDEEKPSRDGVTKSLAEAGFQAQAFTSGQHLLRKYPSLPPGCIVVDIAMSGMGGLELQQRLIAAGCRWPVITLGGNPSRAVVIQAMEAGIIAFLEKPVREAELVAAVLSGHAQLLGADGPQPGFRYGRKLPIKVGK